MDKKSSKSLMSSFKASLKKLRKKGVFFKDFKTNDFQAILGPALSYKPCLVSSYSHLSSSKYYKIFGLWPKWFKAISLE